VLPISELVTKTS
jgi:hypothetical protein